MLEVKNLKVFIGNKEILKGITYTFKDNINYIIVGPNGIGKSTLLKAIAGFPDYKVKGRIMLDGEDVSTLSLNERAKRGIIYVHQNLPPKVAILKDILNELNLEIKELEPFMDRYIFREVSGGEGKLIDFLISYNLKPRVLLIDEIDSGVDKEKIKIIADYLNKFKGVKIIVSHSLMIAKHLNKPKFLTISENRDKLVELKDFSVSK